MSNLIIVEGENDKYFIESLIEALNMQNLEVRDPICNKNDYECMGGINNLATRLRRIRKNDYQKIGVIIDADNDGIESRIHFINKALEEIGDDARLTTTNKFEKSIRLDLEIACYIMNVSGNGELETLLKKIKSKDSTYADCLEAWRKCLQENGKDVKDKTFDKFWVDIYQRYDNCKENESKADENCKGEKSLKKDIWDFENPLLGELKEFLKLFS